MGQRHHLIPRFYLKRWSVGGGAGLSAIRRSTGDVLSLSPKTAAVETDAYAVELPEEGKSYAFEKMLSQVESDAALALANMLDSWPPLEKARLSWSMLMALQITRGRDFRDLQNTVADYFLKTQMALDSRDPAEMRERLRHAGLEATQENLDLMRDMMDHPDRYEFEMHPGARLVAAAETALELLPYLAGRTWSLAVLSEPLLITTDRPLTRHAERDSLPPFMGVGFATADEVWMPLDSTRLLVMSHPGTDPIVGAVPPDKVESVNLRIAVECHEWVFARADNPQVEDIANFLVGKPTPKIEIQGPTPAEWAASARRVAGKGRGRLLGRLFRR